MNKKQKLEKANRQIASITKKLDRALVAFEQFENPYLDDASRFLEEHNIAFAARQIVIERRDRLERDLGIRQ